MLLVEFMVLCACLIRTHWEGGTNVVAFISGPLVPLARRGTHYDGMLHSTDWRTTFAGLAGVQVSGDGDGGGGVAEFARASNSC